MRQIDIQTWPRREHFKVFNSFDYPHFSLCANVDLTTFNPFIKQRGISFTVAVVYVLARAANAIPEFRYRIREGGVVEHKIVHPSATILTDDDLFSFCSFEYIENFSEFAVKAAEMIACVKAELTLEDGPTSPASSGFCAAVCMGEILQGGRVLEDAFERARTSRINGWYSCWQVL
jgi:chloramphenicol O-acetyltransferase type A